MISINTGFRNTVLRKIRVGRKIIWQSLYVICEKSDLTWRYVANLKPTLKFNFEDHCLSEHTQTVVENLKNNGIALTTVNKILGSGKLFEELKSEVEGLDRKAKPIIDERRRKVNSGQNNKMYVIELLGKNPVLDPNCIFGQIALHPEILKVVNNYFGMLTKLRDYQAWHNIPTFSAPRESELWHRDPEDRMILKMFICISDVDEDSGPFNYILGTHSLKKYQREPEITFFKEGNVIARRIKDEDMEKVYPRKNWFSTKGPIGTVIFADTSGFHKGGHCIKKDRLLFNCMYTSQASKSSGDFFFDRSQYCETGEDSNITFSLRDDWKI